MQIMFAVVTERILREYREYWHGAKPVLNKKNDYGDYKFHLKRTFSAAESRTF